MFNVVLTNLKVLNSVNVEYYELLNGNRQSIRSNILIIQSLIGHSLIQI
jgi:hypothetical protein